MNRQERMEYIAEERVRKAIKSLMKEKPNTVAFHSYVYANGKWFDIDVVQVESDLKAVSRNDRHHGQ